MRCIAMQYRGRIAQGKDRRVLRSGTDEPRIRPKLKSNDRRCTLNAGYLLEPKPSRCQLRSPASIEVYKVERTVFDPPSMQVSERGIDNVRKISQPPHKGIGRPRTPGKILKERYGAGGFLSGRNQISLAKHGDLVPETTECRRKCNG